MLNFITALKQGKEGKSSKANRTMIAHKSAAKKQIANIKLEIARLEEIGKMDAEEHVTSAQQAFLKELGNLNSPSYASVVGSYRAMKEAEVISNANVEKIEALQVKLAEHTAILAMFPESIDEIDTIYED